MAPRDASLPPGHVVVVEDSEPVRRSLEFLLRSYGLIVDAYDSAAALLAAPRLPRADCLLIDFKLPTMNGLDLLKALREAGMAAPALMITGAFNGELEQRAREAGFLAVLQKPTQRKQLVSAIEAALSGNAGPAPAAA